MIKFDSTYLNFKDTLFCGQVFRFKPYKNGFMVFTLDKAAYCYNEGNTAIIESDDDNYFYNYFDLSRDYAQIIDSINACNNEKVMLSANTYKGIRILKQDKIEALLSFIVSQNNNIPRIKSIIEKLSSTFGEKKCFLGEDYFSFPTLQALAGASYEDLKACGLGYRAEYIKETAQKLLLGELLLDDLDKLSTTELKKSLLKIKGIGDKVANCVTLFGFGRGDSFPVDTWIEKIYREDFNGTLTDRTKISNYLVDLFKENAGFVQQYMFYAKREGLL